MITLHCCCCAAAQSNLFPTLRHRPLFASLFHEINSGAAAAAARFCDGGSPLGFLPPNDLDRGQSAADDESLPGDGPLIAADEADEKRPRSMRAQVKKRRMGARRRCLLSKIVSAWQSPGVHKRLPESHSFGDDVAGAGQRDGGAQWYHQPLLLRPRRRRRPRSAPSCCKNDRNYSLPSSAQNMSTLIAECT